MVMPLELAYDEKNLEKIEAIEEAMRIIDNPALMKWRERFSGELQQSI